MILNRKWWTYCCWCAIVLLAAQGVSSAAGIKPATKPSDLPKAAPGWKVEVVAQTPDIIDPTMVCVAPDGRVFIAQQTAAMENWNVMEPRDSIVCLHPDGHVTTFATGLYNLFGLAYLDGKLYVTQYPKVTVFTDDNSVGKDPVDLFTVSPFKGGYQQHITANMRFGMDGYFYQSIGDRGLYGTVNKEGQSLEMRGGIVRYRPDGSQLEIYTTGSRNHPDVAITPEDEIFTLDNTDDGAGWNARLTQMVDGGYYGYPHDYKPRRPYTLWCMEDYGGGSATGGLAYNEDALPEEYRGNLIMCEWGRQQLIRFRLAREGATYKVTSREDLLSLPPGGKDFRPVGIALSPDGLSLYIADWHSSRWKENGKTGRLLKLTYTGPSQAAPKPPWWMAAAMNKPFDATTDDLVAALRHPAQSVRIVAQRRLMDRGASGIKPLLGLLADTTAPAAARFHAIWALDGIDGGVAARQQILDAAKGADSAVRAQAIRQLGTRRAREAVEVALAAMKSDDASLRFRAATALGRIADPATVPARHLRVGRQRLFHPLRHLSRAQPHRPRPTGRVECHRERTIGCKARRARGNPLCDARNL